MDIPEHDDSVPASLISLREMVERTADHRYGPGWRGTIKVEDTLHCPDGGFKVTIGEPSEVPPFRRLEDVAELIRAAAENGALLIHFGDGQRPPPLYWRSDPGLASVTRGYFVARYSGILPDYDGKPLFAGEVNFARWLAGVPKYRATAADSPDVKQRRIAPEKTLALQNRIEKVHAVARRLWGQQKTHPEFAVMAAELAKPQHQLGYSEETIRHILNGTYPPAKKLEFGRFELKSPNRPSGR
jgi:hypothetical protein